MAVAEAGAQQADSRVGGVTHALSQVQLWGESLAQAQGKLLQDTQARVP